MTQTQSLPSDVDIRCMMQYSMAMTRTTISLPDELYQRILLTSKSQEKSAAELMRELLEKALSLEEKTALQKLYKGLHSLKGIGGNDVTDASATIDETLYGKNGEWRGDAE